MEENRIPKKVLYMNIPYMILETPRLRSRPRNRLSEVGWKTSWWKTVEG
jgi:hypothetical protein